MRSLLKSAKSRLEMIKPKAKDKSKETVIGFDFLTLPDTALGTRAYLIQTLKALRRASPEAKFVLLATKKFGRDQAAELEALQPIKKIFLDLPESFWLRTYAQQFWTPPLWVFKGADIVHSVGYTSPVGVFAKKVLNLNRRSLRLPQAVLAPILYSSSHIFVESQKLVEELVARFPRLANKVSILPPGVSSEAPAQASLGHMLKPDFPEKFFLHIGSLEEKIRIYKILESFAKVAHRPRFKKVGLLFVASSHDSVTPWKEMAEKFGLRDRVIFSPTMPRAEFLQALSRCEAVIYSGNSLEIPPVVYQAVALKKPVLVSMDPEDIKLFDIAPALIPYQADNAKNLAEQFTFALSSTEIRSWLDANNEIFLQRHSWDELAQSILSVYQKLAPEAFSLATPTSTTEILAN